MWRIVQQWIDRLVIELCDAIHQGGGMGHDWMDMDDDQWHKHWQQVEADKEAVLALLVSLGPEDARRKLPNAIDQYRRALPSELWRRQYD